MTEIRQHLPGPQSCWCGRSDHSVMGTLLHALDDSRAPNYRGCPNDPPCPHPAAVHDIWTHDDPRPMCCADGCACGKTTTAPSSCEVNHPGVTCWRTAPGGYCLEPRCYCGSCPWWQPDTAHHITSTVLDVRAVTSGQRRSRRKGQRD